MATKKSDIDQQLIRDLAGILDDTNLTEIEVELGDFKVRVSRGGTAVHAVAAQLPVAAPAPAAPIVTAAPVAADKSKNAAQLTHGWHRLPVAIARREGLHRSGSVGSRGADPAHYRSNENHELYSFAPFRHGNGHPV